jgi:hypothetical protein
MDLNSVASPATMGVPAYTQQQVAPSAFIFSKLVCRQRSRHLGNPSRQTFSRTNRCYIRGRPGYREFHAALGYPQTRVEVGIPSLLHYLL